MEKARQSLQKSGSDLVIANDVSRVDIGFGAEENEVTGSPEGRRTQILEKETQKRDREGDHRFHRIAKTCKFLMSLIGCRKDLFR